MKKFNLTSEKTMITEERLKAVLLPSFLSIILSVILLCGMTWAWFETTKAGSTEPIRTAEYGMTVTVSKGGVAEIGGDKPPCTVRACGTEFQYGYLLPYVPQHR